MLWDASTIRGSAVEAADGRLEAVSDLLFEDIDWVVRWLVVDTGNWLVGQKVLLSPVVLAQRDASLGFMPVKLTKQQIRGSPDAGTDRPVSKQIASYIYDYQVSNLLGSPGAVPVCTGPATPFTPHVPSISGTLSWPDAEIAAHQYDPHLRSIAALSGSHIHATDGKIGHIEDFLVGDAGWSIYRIIANTKKWGSGKKVLIAPSFAHRIDWAGKLIELDITRQQVENCPRYDATMAANGPT